MTDYRIGDQYVTIFAKCGCSMTKRAGHLYRFPQDVTSETLCEVHSENWRAIMTGQEPPNRDVIPADYSEAEWDV